jgi:hypothetical protein
MDTDKVYSRFFSGVFDSKGNHIHEGDILQLRSKEKGNPIGEVCFGGGAFYVKNVDLLWFGVKNGICADYKVLGNIFEHSEVYSYILK